MRNAWLGEVLRLTKGYESKYLALRLWERFWFYFSQSNNSRSIFNVPKA
jgi:hypothetical protein